jgi:hypothetical protein
MPRWDTASVSAAMDATANRTKDVVFRRRDLATRRCGHSASLEIVGCEGSTKSGRLLAKLPVIVAWPQENLGQIIWPGSNNRPFRKCAMSICCRIELANHDAKMAEGTPLKAGRR